MTWGISRCTTDSRPEVRRCYIHDVTGYPATNEGVGIGIGYGTCNGLFVDNISNQTSSLFVVNGGAANAIIYNYARDCTRGTSPVVMPGLQYHGPQGLMNLMEGNIWPGVCDDGYHGSASHDTIFRNHLNGLHTTRSVGKADVEPLSRNILQQRGRERHRGRVVDSDRV